MNTTNAIHTRRNFRSMSKGALNQTTSSVSTHLFGNEAFPAPPVDKPTLDEAASAWRAALVAQVNGGKEATAEAHRLRAVLEEHLTTLAKYVDLVAGNDLAMLLSSGYEAAQTSRSRVPLQRPQIIRTKNGMSGQTILTVTAQRNVRCYEVSSAPVDENGNIGPFSPPTTWTSSRAIEANGLVPGRLYCHQVRAVGGSTGHSDWSDAVTHRAN